MDGVCDTESKYLSSFSLTCLVCLLSSKKAKSMEWWNNEKKYWMPGSAIIFHLVSKRHVLTLQNGYWLITGLHFCSRYIININPIYIYVSEYSTYSFLFEWNMFVYWMGRVPDPYHMRMLQKSYKSRSQQPKSFSF